MRYWLLEKGDVIGPFEVHELKKREGFSQSTLVCPEEHGTDHSHWRESYYFEDFGFGEDSQQDEAEVTSTFSSFSLPSAVPQKSAPVAGSIEDLTNLVSKNPTENYENISIEEYFENVYQHESAGLSGILGIPDDLENSDLYLGRFLQEQLQGDKKTRNTKIKDLNSGKTINKKAQKSFGNKGEILVSRTVKSDVSPAPAAEDTFTQDEPQNFLVDLAPVQEVKAPATPVVSVGETIISENTIPSLVQAKKDLLKSIEEKKKEVPSSPPPAAPVKEQAPAIKEDKKIVVPPAAEPSVPQQIKQEEPQKAAIVPQPAEKTEAPQESIKTPLPEQKTVAAKETPAAQVQEAPAEIMTPFDKIVVQEEALLEPIKTIEPLHRLEDFLEEDSTQDSTGFSFGVEKKKVSTKNNFETPAEKKAKTKKMVFIAAAFVVVCGCAALIASSLPSRKKAAQAQEEPALQAAAQQKEVKNISARPEVPSAKPAAAVAAPEPVKPAEPEIPLTEHAISVVQDYVLKNKNATVKEYLAKFLDSYIQKGYTSSWSAEHLHKDIYIVKYKLIKTRQEPVIYIFEVDTKKNIITGALNNLTLDLLGM